MLGDGTMNTMHRLLRAQDGIALMAVMMAIFILTIVVAAMAIATMGESNTAVNQLRGQQALAVAEAGAYRALAELRRRLSVDLDAQIRLPSVNSDAVRDACNGANGREPVQLISDYAWPIGLAASDWARSGSTASLSIGTAGSRIVMTDSASGATMGDFYATIAVRWSGAPSTCNYGVTVPEQEIAWFDYAILSVGRSGNATRSVCLRSSWADRCPNWFPTAGASWQGSYALSGHTSDGWPVLIEKASYSEWALMLLDVGSVWLYTGTTINGPVHSNTRIRIAQNPQLNDVVTQVLPDMTFLNGGTPMNINVPATNPNGTLRTSTDNTTGTVFGSTVTGGVAAIPLPSNANPSRTSTGLSPTGPNATDAQVQANTTDPEAAGPSLNDGLYVMNNCGAPNCGGIYIKGDVQEMSLASVSGRQEILLNVQSDPTAARRVMRLSIDPLTGGVRVYWGYSGGNPYIDSNWTLPASPRTYPAGTFNGVIYVNGSITADPSNPAASTGLFGIVNQSMRLTIATQGDLTIADQLVYERPPAGPGDNPLNVLGLYSVTGNITIAGTLTPNDLYIDGVELSPSGSFWVQGWNSLPVKGNIYTMGGTVQGTFGAFGGFSPLTGYGRVMSYDWRLRSNISPPFFPLTDIYTAVRYPSPAPVFNDGDPLYDRPQWEEMVGL